MYGMWKYCVNVKFKCVHAFHDEVDFKMPLRIITNKRFVNVNTQSNSNCYLVRYAARIDISI